MNLFLEFDNSLGLDVDVVDEVHITLTDLNLCFFFGYHVVFIIDMFVVQCMGLQFKSSLFDPVFRGHSYAWHEQMRS